MWTGRYPHANGVVGLTHGDFANDLKPDERHLADYLSNMGYRCHSFGEPHEMSTPTDHGFATAQPGNDAHRIASEFAEFLKEDERDSPFFAEICFFEPHRPFPHGNLAPAPADAVSVPDYLPDLPVIREDLALFDASVSYMDEAFGRITDAIDDHSLRNETIVVFTADHGIPFPRAKMTLYDPGLEIPLIFRGPGISDSAAGGPRITPALVSNVDVAPTILDLLDGPAIPEMHGESFSRVLRGVAEDGRDEVFGEKTYHTYYDPMRCIRTQDWKLIANFEHAPAMELPPDPYNNGHGYWATLSAWQETDDTKLFHPAFELYDLVNDKNEQQNLAQDPRHEQTLSELIRRLRGWMEETDDPLLEGPIPQAAYQKRMDAFRRY